MTYSRDHFVELLRAERPETCHWVGIGAVIRHFGGLINGDDFIAFKTALGKSWRLLLTRQLGYVAHGRHGGLLYVQGQLCNRELKVEMSLCDELNAHLASVQLIVTLQYGTKVAIVVAGGAADMGRALLEFRQDTMFEDTGNTLF